MKRYALKNTKTDQYCTYYMNSYEDDRDLICTVGYLDDDIWLHLEPTVLQKIIDGESVNHHCLDVDSYIYKDRANLVIVEIDFP